MNYDNDNIFAKILNGNMPCYKVYEDEGSFAFLDIMPRIDGHTLVIPKEPARNLLDAEPHLLGPLLSATQRIARASMDVFSADGVIIQQFNEEAAGQVVFHLHFHVLPISQGERLRPPGQMAEKDLLEQHAEMLRRALDNNGSS